MTRPTKGDAMKNHLTRDPDDDLRSAAPLGHESDVVIDLRGGGLATTTRANDDVASLVERLGDEITIDLTTEPPLISFRRQTLPLSIEPPSRRERGLVRIFDVTAASMLMLVLLPVIIATWLAVRVTSRGPAIYRSPRIGQDGQTFDALKFRSMNVDADALLEELLATDDSSREEYGRSHKLRNDPRLTPIGGFIRRSSLDELPQLLNVLAGEMSLVGPRPKLLSEPERFGPTMPTILRVKPGLTGLWQVSGRSDLTFDQRIFLDVEYALNRKLRSDVAICIKTARQALQPTENGAY